MYKKIESSNHKYWQNRYLFSPEFSEFAKQMALNWNTNYVIPAQITCRNNDLHLSNPIFRAQNEQTMRPLTFKAPNDVSINLVDRYQPETILKSQLEVFKFLATFYVGVSQRASNKNDLPDVVKYLKAYINYDETCARWFLTQFCNFPLIRECFCENPPHANIMRKILAGIVYAAMLKLY
jgi:hypothetical protein